MPKCTIWVDGKHWKRSQQRPSCFQTNLNAEVFINLHFNLQIIACSKPIYGNSTLLLPPSSVSLLPSPPTLLIPGQALQCYKCKIGFFDLCLTSKVSCESGEHCFSGVGTAGKSHWVTFSSMEVVVIARMKLHQLLSQIQKECIFHSFIQKVEARIFIVLERLLDVSIGWSTEEFSNLSQWFPTTNNLGQL